MDEVSEQINFLSLKESGNEAFKKGNLDNSLAYYENALKIAKDDRERATIMKNLSAVYLKLGNYDKVIEETDRVLNTFPKDSKALYRKCLALEQLDKIDEAYIVAKQLLTVEPNNRETQSLLQRLYEKVQERMRHYNDINVKVETMCKYAFDNAEDFVKREKALNNILILASENSSSEVLYRSGIASKIFTSIKAEPNGSLYALYIKIVAELCKGREQRTKEILSQRDVSWFLELMNRKDASLVSTGQYCLQTILYSLTGLDDKNPDVKPDPEACNRNRERIEEIFTALIRACNSHAISGLMRDAVIKLLTRNIHYECLNWAHKFVELKGLQRLMEVASEMSEYKYESSMELTDSTKTLISVCLARIYENMYCDKDRSEYLDNISDFIKDLLLTPDVESKVRVTVAITVLLQGPLDIGNNIIAREGVLDMILVMAGCDDLVQQKVASECIVSAITKQDKAQAVVSKGIDILKKLYTSQHESIRIRALVGLCKVSSSGGTDASIQPLDKDTNESLAAACRKFLVESEDADAKFWAIEGLSFLTLDAEIKEILIQDLPAINALIDIAKQGNMSSAYGIVTTFVNLCNAYEKQEVLPEMIELAKFAKRHIPETHPYDKDDYVTKRVLFLGRHGAPSVLVALSKTESHNCKELIGRVFNVLCGQPELRGLIVQQGGVKTLLELSLVGTLNGKRHSAQALARIGITMNPQIAFPGERCVEVIRPLLMLLHPDCCALMNFEALLALCNIASIGEKTCSHILKEGGFGKIESYLYEDHLMLRRAAAQCITNLIVHSDVVKLFEAENDRFKFLFLLSSDSDDEETAKAAAGAVAMLTNISEKCCNKLFTIKQWNEIMKELLVNSSREIQHRCLVIAKNVMASSKTNAERIMNSEVRFALMAISVFPGDELQNVRDLATECLKIAKQFNIEVENDNLNDKE